MEAGQLKALAQRLKNVNLASAPATDFNEWLIVFGCDRKGYHKELVQRLQAAVDKQAEA